MNNYFEQLNKLPQNRLIRNMKNYAEANNVPIISEMGLAFILHLVDFIKPKSFLEIGTAIGFSSISLATYKEDLVVDTIEREDKMYEEAVANVKAAKLEERIRLFHEDALEIDLNLLKDEYDLIFIDGAKAQYIKFFEKFSSKLSPNGIIVTDNLLFHGFVVNRKNIESKNLKDLVRKIDSFNIWLSKNRNFQTSFFSIADGMSVSRRIK